MQRISAVLDYAVEHSGRVGLLLACILVPAVLIDFVRRISPQGHRGRTLWEHVASAINAKLNQTFAPFAVALVSSLLAVKHAYAHRIFTFDHRNPLSWVALLILTDFIRYWEHRAQHRMRVLWALHVVHHSYREFSALNGARFPLIPTTTLLILPFIAWCGFSPKMMVAGSLFEGIIGILQHCDFIRRIPFDGSVLAGPEAHRVHHSNEPQYLDKNFGHMTVIWDRLFGTYVPLKDRNPSLGLVKNFRYYIPLVSDFRGFRTLLADVISAPTLMAKLRYVFMPPGWRHDGKSLTSEVLRDLGQKGMVSIDRDTGDLIIRDDASAPEPSPSYQAVRVGSEELDSAARSEERGLP